MATPSSPDHCSIDTMLRYRSTLTPEEVAGFYSALNAIGKDQRQSAQAIYKYIGKVAADDAWKKVNNLNNLIKTAKITQDLSGAPSAYKGLTKIARSVDSYSEIYAQDINHPFVNELKDRGLLKAAESGMHDLDIYREIAAPGSTDNAVAKQIAPLYQAKHSRQCAVANRFGARVEDSLEYMGRQTHNARLVRRMGMAEWCDLMENSLSPETYEGAPARPYLEAAWKGIVSGFHTIHNEEEVASGLVPAMFQGQGDIAKQLSAARRLIFKSPEALFEYTKLCSGESLFALELNQGRNIARKSALMQHLGSKPTELLHQVEGSLTRLGKADELAVGSFKRKLYEGLAQALVGTEAHAGANVYADIGAYARASQTVSKLGSSAAASVFLDPVSRFIENRRLGITLGSRLKELIAPFPRYLSMDEDVKVMATSFASALEAGSGTFLNRFDGEMTGPGLLNRGLGSFMKITGMPLVTEVQKVMHAAYLTAFHAQHADRVFAALPERTRKSLAEYGISAEDWEVLRTKALWEAKAGSLYIDPRLITMTHPDLSAKYRAYIADSIDNAILTPGTVERALAYQNAQHGTIPGELMYTFMQFKIFPMTFLNRTVKNAWGEGGWEGAKGIIQMVAIGTALGYACNTFRDMAQGIAPMDITEDNWKQELTRAFITGGGATIIGELAYATMETREGDSYLSVLAGPTASSINSLGHGIAQLFDENDRDDNGNVDSTKLLKAIKKNIPGNNLLYTRWAFNYLLCWRLQEYADPGFLDRTNANLSKYGGKEYFDGFGPTDLE